jgi:hypothetical protein
MSRKRNSCLVWPPRASGVRVTSDGELVVVPSPWLETPPEIFQAFFELWNAKKRLEARNRKPETPERDHHFRVLFDSGWSYLQISRKDPQALAANLSRDAVIAAVRRDKRPEKI